MCILRRRRGAMSSKSRLARGRDLAAVCARPASILPILMPPSPLCDYPDVEFPPGDAQIPDAARRGLRWIVFGKP